MRTPRWSRLRFAALACLALIVSATAGRADAQAIPRERGWRLIQPDLFSRQAPRRHDEPAFARGYADGYRIGLGDGRSRQRYDPAGNPDYRRGDQGYSRSYGSRDAYRNNYRAGFRLGYEEGYRDGTR